MANAVLLKLILLLTGALYLAEELAQEMMACSYPKATIREEVHCCHAKFTGDWEKKKCAVPSFFQPVTLRVANCLICACVSARESSAKPNPPNNSF